MNHPLRSGTTPSCILVPVNCSSRDEAALELGLEWAAVRNAELVVLHVRDNHFDPSLHWLDAIDRLYAAMDGTAVPHADRQRMEQDRSRLSRWIDRAVASATPRAIPIRAIVRYGDVADVIARTATEIDAHNIVMSCDLTGHWLSILPRTVRRVAALTTCRIILATPEPAPRSTSLAFVN